ncbi:MAG TPA: ribosome recycling factor [Alphaproteobacteria bacterium]|nr:ribosome recycling factor [Alphaproteobacteria bacterium]
MTDPNIKDLERRMQGALEVLKREFSGLRTGRASISLLDPITVEVYGQSMPINQVGTISAPEPRLLTVQVWDNGNVQSVVKAIQESALGLNPQPDGQLVRVPIPELTEERRLEMAKIAHKYAEQTRVAIRNVRRDGMEDLKRKEKEREISEDEHKAWSSDIQKLTDRLIEEVDEALKHKEQEITQV